VGNARLKTACGLLLALSLVGTSTQLMASPPEGEPDPGRPDETPFLRAPRLDLLYDVVMGRNDVGGGNPGAVRYNPAVGPLQFDLVYPTPGRHHLGPRTVELSPLGRVAYGADKGAYLGLFAGYLGTLAGAWDEATALRMMAAGAALGAIYAGTLGPSHVHIQVRPD
jgi:hypothetical protein